MVRVVSHLNDPAWRAKYRANGFINGAWTYSKEIVKYHVPVIKKLLAKHGIKHAIIGTCNLVLSHKSNTEVIIQYIHNYKGRDGDPIGPARKVVRENGGKVKIIFITPWKNRTIQLQEAGMNAVWLPMSVDTRRIRRFAATPSKKYGEGRVIYFGNVRSKRRKRTVKRLRREFARKGWKMDIISKGRLNNGKKYPTQGRALREVGKYGYGIGIGRCAQEMLAMGMKVMVAGSGFGGIMASESDWQAQLETNINGAARTFDDNVGHCIDCFRRSILPEWSVQRSLEYWKEVDL